MEYASSLQYEQEAEKAQKMAKNLKIGNTAVFVLKMFFFLWIMSARYQHTGRVCSGDYSGYEEVKTGSNYVKDFSYSYVGFPGLIMKLYVWLFMLKMFIRGTIALWLGTDWDPEDDDEEEDDNYRPATGGFSYAADIERPAANRNSFGGSKWNEKNHRGMFDSPEGKSGGGSPVRHSIGVSNPGKFQKNKPSDYEQKVQEAMAKTMKAKVEGRKYSSKDKASSKKSL